MTRQHKDRYFYAMLACTLVFVFAGETNWACVTLLAAIFLSDSKLNGQ